ncbi:hypothetical protein [Pseudonocardia sp. GCM10023141]|uniref:hypothetical protein n=1 Tax=Pseudonocardia sp. GCM10023141 TaxID=3252653 RepID=UPI0036062008
MRPFVVFVGGGLILVGAWTANWTLGLLAGLLLWLATVQLWPWTACSSCASSPRIRDFTGKNWRTCGGCGGTGKELRTFVMRRNVR